MILPMIALLVAMSLEHWTTWWIDSHCIYEEKNPFVRAILKHLGMDGWAALKIIFWVSLPLWSYAGQMYWTAGVFAIAALGNGYQIWKVTR